MSVREVVVWPDPRLRQPSVAVTEFGPALRALYPRAAAERHLRPCDRIVGADGSSAGVDVEPGGESYGQAGRGG